MQMRTVAWLLLALASPLAIAYLAHVLGLGAAAHERRNVSLPDSAPDAPTAIKTPADEHTLVLLKPSALQRGLVGELLARFEHTGLKLTALKAVRPSRALVQEHYREHAERPFFASIVAQMAGGTPVVAAVWTGRDAVRHGRALVGATDPAAAAAGSIRGDRALSPPHNLVHASATSADAEREASLWFSPSERLSWTQALAPWLR